MKVIYELIKYFSKNNSRVLTIAFMGLISVLSFSAFVNYTEKTSTQRIAEDYVCSPGNCSGTCVKDPESQHDFCVPKGGTAPGSGSGSGSGGSGTPGEGCETDPDTNTTHCQVPVGGGVGGGVGAGGGSGGSPSDPRLGGGDGEAGDGGDGEEFSCQACTTTSGKQGFCAGGEGWTPDICLSTDACPNGTTIERSKDCSGGIGSCQVCYTPPTPTATPSASISPEPEQGNATLGLNIKMPGIGTNTGIGENNSPKNNSREFTISLFDSSDKLVKDTTAKLTYNNGAYTGNAEITDVKFGPYSIKVKSNNSLLKAVPGVVTLAKNKTINLPFLTLTTGNLEDSGNSSNILDLLDYNALLGCLGGNCSILSKADLNDDGVINAKDLNILLRGFINRNGD